MINILLAHSKIECVFERVCVRDRLSGNEKGRESENERERERESAREI